MLAAERIGFGDLVEVKVSNTNLDQAIQTKEIRLRELAELLTDPAHIVVPEDVSRRPIS